MRFGLEDIPLQFQDFPQKYFQQNFFHHSRYFGAFYSLAVIVCGIIFYRIRLEFGIYHTVWLIGIVVVTDTAGYIFGRILVSIFLLPLFFKYGVFCLYG